MAEVSAAIYDDYTEITCNGAQCTRIVYGYPKYMLCGDHYELRQAPTAEIKDGQLQITQCSNKDVYDIIATDKSGKTITDLKVVQATQGHNIQFNITSKEQLDKVQLTPVVTEAVPKTINNIDWSDAVKQGIDVKQLPDKLILDEIPFDGEMSLIDPWVNVTTSTGLTLLYVSTDGFGYPSQPDVIVATDSMITYLKINLTSIASSTVNSASLKMYLNSILNTGNVNVINMTCTGFDATTMTYASRLTQCPTTGATLTSTSALTTGWKSIDISTAAMKNRVIYLVLNATDSVYAQYDRTGTNAPYVSVDYTYTPSDPLFLADFSNVLFIDKNNSQCSNSYTRADALNPNTPWCNLDTALDKVNGNDTVYVVGNYTYFGYYDLQNRQLNGTLRILAYPGSTPNLTQGQENIWNGTATWVDVSTGSPNIWQYTGDFVNSRGFITLDNGSTLITTTAASDITNYGAIGMCHYNDTPNTLTCRFNDTSYNPNGKKIHARGKQQETLKFENIDAYITIAGFRIPNSDYGIYVLNVSNLTIVNNSFYTNRYDIYINSGTGGKISNGIYIRNNNFTFRWDDAWTWGDFYTSGIQNAQPGHILLDGQNGPIKSVFIQNNTFSGSFDGIRQKMTSTSSEDHEYSYNNFSDIHDDAFELGETTNQNTTIKNTYMYDVFVCFSTAPANSTLSMSYIYNNICFANKSVLYTRPATYWAGKAVKNYNESGKPASINWSWSNNLLYGGGVLMNSRAWETRTPYLGQVNFNNVTNNILYAKNTYVMYGSGNNTNTLFDYNDYYREIAGNLGAYWGLESDATPRANLAAAKAAVGFPAAWDVHSTDLAPGYDTSNSSYGGMAYLLWNSTLIDAGVLQPFRTTDFFGNPIYGTPDIGPIEYQPPYSLTNFIYNASPTIYKDGKYRVNTSSTQLLNFTLAPISGWATYISNQARPYFATLTTAYINKTQSSYFITLSEPTILTVQVWSTATGARVFLNNTYTNQSINLNSSGWGSFYASHLNGNYTFKGYDHAVFDGSRNLTTFYIDNINQSSSQSFQIVQVNQTGYHIRNYENYTASMQLNFSFIGYNYTCTDFTRLIYVSDTGAYTRTYLANDPDIACINATNSIIVNITGIEPAVGSNSITLSFTPLGVPTISNNPVFETDLTEFGLYINPAAFNISYVEFYHADTIYQTPAVYSNNYNWYNQTVYAPIIGEDPSRIIYFYWIVYFLNGSSQQTATFNYTVVPIWFDNCSRSPNATLQYFLFDENAVDSQLTTETFELTANYYYADRGLMKNFSINLSGENNYTMCLYPGNESFYVDAYVKYKTAGGFTHRHYLSNHSINSTQQNISIYNTVTTVDYSTLVLTVRDKSTYNYFDDGIVAMQRYYVADNTWRTVQMGYTGAYGNLPFNIIEKTTDYRFIMYDTHNHLLETSGTLQFTCTDARCDLTYLILPYSSLATLNITAWHVYDNITGIVRTYWHGNTLNKTINTRVTLHSGAQTRTICDENSTAIFGQSICDISGKEGLYQVNVIVYGSVIAQYSAFIERARAAISDFISESEGSFWSFGIILVVAALGFFSPAAAVFAATFAFIMLGYLGILSGLTFMATIGVIVISVVVGLKLRN